MKNKTLVILVAILFFLVAVLVLKNLTPRIYTETSPYLEKLKFYNKNDIQSILIKKSTDSIELKKEGGVWKLNGKNANEEKVNQFIDSLFISVSPEKVAQTNKKHEEFELTKEKALTVVFDNSLIFLIGKSSGAGAYVRFEDEDNVYLLDSITGSISSKVHDWYDKTILKFDREKAKKIVFKQHGKKATSIIRKEDKWIDEVNGKEINQEKLNSVLSQISNLSARQLYEPEKGVAYSSYPLLILTVEFEEKVETLEFYKGSSDYLLKRTSDKEQFVVGESDVSSIISAPKEIL